MVSVVVDVAYVLNRNKDLGVKKMVCPIITVGDSFRWYVFLCSVESFVQEFI